MKTERIDWIDWAKAICIFLMVCGHSHPTKYVHDFLYQFHLPVFFIISGLLYKPKDFKNLCICLLVPTVIWNLINYPWYLYNIINEHKNLSFNNIFLQPFLGLFFHDYQIGVPICGPFWFVIVIFIMRVYQSIITTSKYLQYASIAICIIIAYISNEAPQKNILFLFQRASIAYPFFCLGIYIRNNPKILSTIDKFPKQIFFITTIILFIFPIIKGSFDLYSCQLNSFPSYYIMGVVGFIFIYLLTNKISTNIKTPSFIHNISNGTLVILGLHNITLFILSKLTNHTDFIGRGELFSIATIIILYIPTIYITNNLPFLIGKGIYNQKDANKKHF